VYEYQNNEENEQGLETKEKRADSPRDEKPATNEEDDDDMDNMFG